MKVYLTIAFSCLLLTTSSVAKIWTISNDGEYKLCSEISSLISDSDTIDIEVGLYENDKQVTWSKNNLLIRGINGKPILKAGSTIANDNSNGKGIFVIRGNNTIVENIEFQNAKVQSRNGAGIRQEGSNLIVRRCIFWGNEMGILQGGTIADCKILVEHCKFFGNGSPENPGYQHNIYINHIDTLIFRYNFSQDAIAEGHEFKSRASNNFILYNRISNLNSIDSRNIDLPNGGTAIILGNIIEQGENSSNSNIIGFGLEGLVNPGPHNLWICSNTIVNKKSKGSFIQVADIDTLFMKNNIFVGAKTGGFIIGTPASLDTAYNLVDNDYRSPMFVDVDANDYNLTKDSPALDTGIALSQVALGLSLKPTLIYKDTADWDIRLQQDNLDIGAYEYLNSLSVENEIYSKSKGLIIYPNPANDDINVTFSSESGKVNIQLTDFLGNQVYSSVYNTHTGINSIKIKPDNIYTGLYILRISNSRQSISNIITFVK